MNDLVPVTIVLADGVEIQATARSKVPTGGPCQFTMAGFQCDQVATEIRQYDDLDPAELCADHADQLDRWHSSARRATIRMRVRKP